MTSEAPHSQRRQRSTFHMDMTVPIWGVALVVLTLLAQSGSGVWWVATLSGRVSVIEQRIHEQDKDHDTLARVDERTANLVETVNRIDQRLSQAEQRTK